MNKLSKFQSFAYSTFYDIIAITETWLSNSIYDNEILPTGYSIYRNDRTTRGGGVLIAVKDYISSVQIQSPIDLEIVTVEVNAPSAITVCAVYIPPNAALNYCQSLITYLHSLSLDNSKKLFVVGDFNFPDINWHTMTSTAQSSSLFCDYVFENNLTQMIQCPTHIKGNILDLVLTNSDDLISDIAVHPPSNTCLNSDHFFIEVTFSTMRNQTPPKPTAYIWDYSKADYNAMCDYLLSLNLNNLLSSRDLEYIWSQLKQAVFQSMELFIPKVHLRAHQRPKWFTSELVNKLNKIHSLRKKCKSHPTQGNISNLHARELELQTVMQEAKSLYEQSLVHNHACRNNSEIFKYIKSLSSTHSLPPSLKLDSACADTDSGKAKLFNQFFHSVFTVSHFNLPDTEKLPAPNQSLSDITISQGDVFEELTSLNPNKAMGVDQLSPKILNFCAPALYIPLHHLLTQCISRCDLPAQWRTHRITPVFKSGAKIDVKNYRPISLLCTISKVLERLIYNKIIDFVNARISSSQFGFLRNRSTLHQLLSFLNEVFSSLEDNSQVDTIYLDFRKAFDSVPHNELLCKLWSFGFTGNLWKWFKSYLSGRSHYVSINDSCSEILSVVSGVPQGSILGPLLFIIYVNDLPQRTVSASTFLFADDAKCSLKIKVPTDCQLLQTDLNFLSDWSLEWKLVFNELKCVLVRFIKVTSTPIESPYILNDLQIASVNSHKDLGITISPDLSWSEHIGQLLSKAYRSLGLLRRTFSNSCSVTTRKSLYVAIVRSSVSYCSPVWRPHLKRDIIAMEQLQKRATKFILNDYSSDYRVRLLTLKLLPLMMLLELNDIMFFVRCLKQPSPCFDIGEYVTFCSGAGTRSASHNRLKHTISSNNTTRNFYFNRLPRLWNHFPTIDLSQSTHTIKSKLKLFIWSHFTCNFVASNSCTWHVFCPCQNCSHIPRSYYH